MRKIQESQTLLSRLFSNRYFLFIWIVGCILIGVHFIQSGLQTKQAFFAKEHAEQELSKEEKEALELMDKLKEADSPLEKERRIRNELNMQKPGEIILQLPSPSP